jgi:uncharacterized metal-binding protein YceD (DUF177 family)
MMDTVLDWAHETRSVPEAGLPVARDATPEERNAIATALDLVACKRLAAKYAITPIGRGHYRLKGSVTIDVTQACVVTLAPLERTYTMPLDLELWPAEELSDSDETEIDTLKDDPEPIEDGRIDVGRIVHEELISGIDPYPRSEGAAFDWKDSTEAVRDNPFAQLEKLKRRSD